MLSSEKVTSQGEHRLRFLASGDALRRRIPGGWRCTVVAGALATLLVLVANVALLVWAEVKHGSSSSGSSSLTIYSGSCSGKNDIVRWSQLTINILSTLLLAASSTCMQVLAAPTREDMDVYHSRGIWLDVGIFSMGNLRWIPRKRLGLWIALCLSSTPFHMV